MFPFRFIVVDDDASEVLAMMKDVDALGAMGEEEMEEVGESVENGVEGGVETGVEGEVEEVGESVEGGK